MKYKKISIPKSIQKHNIEFYDSAPFFSEFLNRFTYYQLPEEEDARMGVNGKDGAINLFVKLSWWEELEPIEQKAIIIHEIEHLLRFTHLRSIGYSHELFNVAHDMIINNGIEQSMIGNEKLRLIKNCCRLTDITEPKQKEVMTAMDQAFIDDPYTGDEVGENVYAYLKEKNQESGGDGSVGETIDDHSIMEESDDTLENSIKEASNAGRNRGWGNISGNMVSNIEKLMNPRLNLRKVIKRIFDNVVSRSRNWKRSWSRSNRYHSNLKGKVYFNSEINIAIDTSASVTQWYKIIEEFFAEIDCLSGYSEIKVAQFDTEVKDYIKYKKGDWKNFEIKGHGGTMVQPLFDFFNVKGLKKQPCIIFTDGEFDQDFNTYGMDITWVVINKDKLKMSSGTTINLDPLKIQV